ncbi:assimilatory sulfite reductase (NADPH) flavoprotein subunit [Halomonas sp. McH1-25]|uniref:assimilatory sulfite reductase (NADPH) flavoprotein subunit n=2 Tax=Halomonas TaxID=2745 RepID=UPI001EF4F806|nr:MULTISPECIES: assimilatory sulfite reductase (NADPH) flavoprotein subunit [unclassified Halomonas]MCG7602024.1 assimilatory sulfite reductase (NADPH) flavoprotein subunit [Halomonas sp. McH1-25]MCP1344614.1 assimilatory sulfite reductase (NADPH) flavoprotein subunit [Halomonas sp. FL8]
MSQGPLLETNSPLSADQAQRLNEALAGLSTDQMTWLSGYLAGLSAQSTTTPPPPHTAGEPSAPEIVVLYGSQTGNAEGVAEQAVERAKARGFPVRLADMADFGKKELKEPLNLMVVVSTQGDGDPPDTAEGFYEFMHGRKAPKLDERTRFAVLSLGDSSYEHYCQTGKDFDARLEALGASRIHDRTDCDVDYEETAERWIEAVLDRYAELSGGPDRANRIQATAAASPSQEAAYSKKNPFQAEVLESVVLNGRGSDKETHHIELSLEGSGLSYEPGDAIGIVPQNDPRYVDELIDRLRMDADCDLGDGRCLRDALLTEYEVTTLTRPFLEHWAEVSEAAELRRLMDQESRNELRDWIEGRHIIDVIEHFPVERIDAETLTKALRKLPPRLYSIASSYQADPDEVHLTVGIVRYETHGRSRGGVTTTYLADRIKPGDSVPIYVDRNKNFKLPQNDDTPIIMVGPGTGIAPFRAFLQERDERDAQGRNWLFFGDRHFRSDFLYQSELLNYRKKGLLNRLDVAFSRDQANKVYVQDRMRENARELYAWLQEGAHFYVCGDGERMAADVHRALIDSVRDAGGFDDDGAAEYVRELQQAKRYQRDVY